MDALTFLVFAAAAMAVMSLFNGIVSMAHGGAADQAHSHQLMFSRTAWQGLAVLLMMFALLASLAST